MSKKRFAITFAITLGIVAVVMWLFANSTDTAPYIDIGWYATAIFSILSIAVYYLTEVISDTDKKTLFLQLVMINMLVKLVLSALIVLLYYKSAVPDDGVFVLPFIAVYVIFTVFETYFMNVQATAR